MSCGNLPNMLSSNNVIFNIKTSILAIPKTNEKKSQAIGPSAQATGKTCELQPRTKKPTLPKAEANGMDSEHHAGWKNRRRDGSTEKDLLENKRQDKFKRFCLLQFSEKIYKNDHSRRRLEKEPERYDRSARLQYFEPA